MSHRALAMRAPHRRFGVALAGSILVHFSLSVGVPPGAPRGSHEPRADPPPLIVRLEAPPAQPNAPAAGTAQAAPPAPQGTAPQRGTPPRVRARQAPARVPQRAAATPPAVDERYYSARELDVYPALLTPFDASPTPAFAREVPARVRLALLINASGSVDDVVVIDAQGTQLDEAARRALLAARFRPALKAGRAVNARLVIDFARAVRARGH